MPVNSQIPVPYTHGLPLAGVLVKTLTDAQGVVSHGGFWNYEAEGWDTEFDPAKHVRPFSVLDPLPETAGGRHQAWGVPREPLYDPSVLGLIYTTDKDGALKDVAEALPWRILTSYIGIV